MFTFKSQCSNSNSYWKMASCNGWDSGQRRNAGNSPTFPPPPSPPQGLGGWSKEAVWTSHCSWEFCQLPLRRAAALGWDWVMWPVAAPPGGHSFIGLVCGNETFTPSTLRCLLGTQEVAATVGCPANRTTVPPLSFWLGTCT